MLSPVPGAEHLAASGPPGDRSRARRRAGADRARPRAAVEQVGAPPLLARRVVAGAARVAAVGERCGAGLGEVGGHVVVRQQHPLDPGRVLGLVVAQPAQLGHGEGRHQHAAHRLGTRLGTAVLARSAPRPRRPSGCRSRAGPAEPGRPSPSRATMPCCWPPTATAAARSSEGRRDGVGRRQPRTGVHLGARLGAERCRVDDHTLVGVHQEGLRGLRRGVDSEHQGHGSIFSTSLELKSSGAHAGAGGGLPFDGDRTRLRGRRPGVVRRLQRRRRGPAVQPRRTWATPTSRTSSTAATRRRRSGRRPRATATRLTRRPTGESLDQRIAQEEPEADPYDATDVDDEDLDDGEVGDQRAGRLVDLDEGLGEDTEKDLVADDVGIDGAAASAEEAAVHIVPDQDGY